MARLVGKVTIDVTGEVGIPVPFEPSVIRTITGGQVNTYQTSACQQGQGIIDTDSGSGYCTAMVKNANGNYTRTYPTSQVGEALYAILAGTGDPVCIGKYLEYDEVEEEVVLDVDAGSSSYQILFEFEE